MEPFLASKAFDFGATALAKCVSVVIKGLLVLGVIALVVWSIYVTVVKPHTKPTPTTTQQAEQITNITHNYPKPTFGCMYFRISTVPEKVPKAPVVQSKTGVK